MLGLLAVLVSSGALCVLFADRLVGYFLKSRVQRRIASALPGYSLQISNIECRLIESRLTCFGVDLTTSGAVLRWRIGKVTIVGLHWWKLLSGPRTLARIAANCQLEIENVEFESDKSKYKLECKTIRASISKRSILADRISLRPLGSDDEFFAASEFRRARIDLKVAHCRVSAMDFVALWSGQAWRAELIEFEGASLNSLINGEKLLDPTPRNPMLWKEFLVSRKQLIQFQRVNVRNGEIKLSLRRAADATPGVLTIDDVDLSLEGFANHGGDGDLMRLGGQGKLMGSSILSLRVSMPVNSTDLSFTDSATLTRLNLSQLNAFLEGATHVRIQSGVLELASCQIEVRRGHALGTFRGQYRDLQIDFLDQESLSETGVLNRLKSFLADHIALRTSNPTDLSEPLKIGTIDYTRAPEEKLIHFWWFSIQSGIFDVLGVPAPIPRVAPVKKGTHP